MAQDLSIEHPDHVVLITIRTIGSRLWFVNNKKFIERVLAFLAKYQQLYGVQIFAFVIMGNHYHLLARFPNCNRAAFLRSFNSIFARLATRYVVGFRDGSLWARRARVQIVPNAADVMHTFSYVSLNPISSGLCMKLSEFNGYSSLKDALSQSPRTYRMVDWADYDNRRRYNATLKPSDCEKTYQLTFARLPSMESFPLTEYRAKVIALVEARKEKMIADRREQGKGFAGNELLRKIKTGARPRNSKTSRRDSKRPLVLTLCSETKRRYLNFYFATLAAYQAASKLFRSGYLTTEFPPGTYRPVLPVPV